ncbi:MAG: hypothetical protein GX998_05025 [Firmicutes bacterium]|nr:hypothetical protein [Bacillota bacterium]
MKIHKNSQQSERYCKSDWKGAMALVSRQLRAYSANFYVYSGKADQ